MGRCFQRDQINGMVPSRSNPETGTTSETTTGPAMSFAAKAFIRKLEATCPATSRRATVGVKNLSMRSVDDHNTKCGQGSLNFRAERRSLEFGGRI